MGAEVGDDLEAMESSNESVGDPEGFDSL
jgi:hypothetical protein